jgi:putative membrane protein insertion efficiency factor
MTRGLLWVLKTYQGFISPFFPSACRFTPTCSEYARQAVVRHGAVKGTWMGFKRLCRCHPFSSGGFHPVP